MELFAFFVCQALVQITEIGFGRCLFEEFNEICLRLVVECRTLYRDSSITAINSAKCTRQ